MKIRVILFLIGALLTFAAVGKIWHLVSDPFADIRSGFPIAVLWFGVFVELGVVWVLTSKAEVSIKWFFASMLFVVFLSISAFKWGLGYKSCGCAGSLEMAPWMSGLVSLAVLALLWKVRADSIREHGEWNRWHAFGLWTTQSRSAFHGFVGFLTLGLVFSVVNGTWLSVVVASTLTAGVKGPHRLELGDLESGVAIRSSVEIENFSKHQVCVLGSRTSCVCVSDQKERIVIPAHGSATIPFVIEPRTTGGFYNRIVFFLDSPNQRTVAVNLSGFVSSNN